MRVLIVKLSSLGDVVHTLPAVSDAAATLATIRFDWVVEEAFAEIPQWHPAVERVIPVAIRRWRKRPLRDFRGEEWHRARAALRRQRYDAVIDAQGLVKSALIARLVAAPRYGMDFRSVRERLAATAYHHRIGVPRELHAVERSRVLFASALGYRVPDRRGDYGLQGQFGSAQQMPPGLLFLHGTARREKLWPVAHWVQLAELAVAHGFRVWLPWGSHAERLRAQDIIAMTRCAAEQVQLLPALDLAGLADRLESVSGAVAVDTGLGHLAAALDVPTVSLYGPTRPALVGAYGRNQVHLQASAEARAGSTAAMMQSIAAADVWQTMQLLLARCDDSGNQLSSVLGEE